MKLILSFFLAFSVQANDAINVKVSDGMSAYCQKKADVYNNRFGAYSAAIKSLVATNDEVNIELVITSLRCILDNDVYKFITVNALENFTYTSLLLSGNLQTNAAEPTSANLIFFRDGIYKVLNLVELKNEDIQSVKTSLKLVDVLTNEEIVMLNEGKTIIGNFDYKLQRKIKINNEKYPSDFNYGAFRIHFKAELNNQNQIEFKLLK